MESTIKEDILQVRFKGAEVDVFQKAFASSGFRSQTEFIRYMINEYYKANIGTLVNN